MRTYDQGTPCIVDPDYWRDQYNLAMEVVKCEGDEMDLELTELLLLKEEERRKHIEEFLRKTFPKVDYRGGTRPTGVLNGWWNGISTYRIKDSDNRRLTVEVTSYVGDGNYETAEVLVPPVPPYEPPQPIPAPMSPCPQILHYSNERKVPPSMSFTFTGTFPNGPSLQCILLGQFVDVAGTREEAEKKIKAAWKRRELETRAPLVRIAKLLKSHPELDKELREIWGDTNQLVCLLLRAKEHIHPDSGLYKAIDLALS